MTINEELHRLILRKRWLRWSLRNWKPGYYRYSSNPNSDELGRHLILSARLTRWKPTWAERQRGGI